jgi:methyltransferase (TIGR00027 family)
MITNQASRTALGAAMLRAAHQFVDLPPVFVDPLALRILGAESEAELRTAGERWTSRTAAALRAFVAVRSRTSEDHFAAAYARGVRQYVVVGAGLDTFAYRHAYDGLTVVEVDHPATQADKRARLADARLAIAEHTTLAPVDFERETLRDGLARAGLDFARPAFFTWLGVTPYLTRDAIHQTLQVIARAAPGSELAFDFAEPPPPSGEVAEARAALAQRVSEQGEPFRSELIPDELRDELAAVGFSRVALAGPAALNARYFADPGAGRDDGLRLRSGHMAHAWV